MNLFKRFFARQEPEHAFNPEDEQAVILNFDMSQELGSTDEVERVHAFADRLDDAAQAAGVGDLDGDEFGDDECTLYLYCSDAGKLLDVLRPIIAESSFKPMRVTQRFGSVHDQNAETKKMVIT